MRTGLLSGAGKGHTAVGTKRDEVRMAPVEEYRFKVKGIDRVKEECLRLKSSGKKIVFTNGCFDILHPGHCRYLFSARALGDYLVVAVNSDRSVREIKGSGRPILSEEARAEVLASLECVDSVFVFDEATPLVSIKALMPHILVKGGDWGEEEIVGSDVIQAAGGEVRRIPYISGYSTTSLIERILHLHKSSFSDAKA
jgi:D-glycero-beta-D-manno-heptose 1-phosphate adenylyltransferase